MRPAHPDSWPEADRFRSRQKWTIDDVILRGSVTVRDTAKRFEHRVRVRLEKLRVRGIVIREGRGGAYREFTFKMLRPELAAKALREKGGLARPVKATPRPRKRAS
jgi:hypothetical protein